MKFKRQLIRLLVAIIVVSGGVAMAADTKSDQKAAPSTQGTNRMDMNRMMQGGMSGMMHGDRASSGEDAMHGGMMNMMEMMGHCSQMMGSASPMSGMPQLPPGNDKLQLQMQAEMMQKIGEILSNYAGRLQDSRSSR